MLRSLVKKTKTILDFKTFKQNLNQRFSKQKFRECFRVITSKKKNHKYFQFLARNFNTNWLGDSSVFSEIIVSDRQQKVPQTFLDLKWIHTITKEIHNFDSLVFLFLRNQQFDPKCVLDVSTFEVNKTNSSLSCLHKSLHNKSESSRDGHDNHGHLGASGGVAQFTSALAVPGFESVCSSTFQAILIGSVAGLGAITENSRGVFSINVDVLLNFSAIFVSSTLLDNLGHGRVGVGALIRLSEGAT